MKQYIFTDSSTIWKNTYGCGEQYIFSTDLYLISMLDRAYDIIVDIVYPLIGVGEPSPQCDHN